MKRMQKLASLLLALVMVFSMTTTVFAAGTNTIKVTGAQAKETYNIYKMLDLSISDDKTAYSYTVNVAWKNFFENSGAGATYVDITEVSSDLHYVTWKSGEDSAANMETFAKAAASYAVDNKIAAVKTITPSSDGDITFTELDSGYYLITSTNGTLAMIDTTPDKNEVTVAEKNPDPTLEKKVQEDSTSNFGDNNSAQIGDTVEFEVTIYVRKGARNYVMHDKMEDGLSFNVNSVGIEGLIEGTDYTVITNNLDDGCTFEIRFSETYLNGLTKDATLTVTYNAVLNEKADITNGEKNNAKITWGDKSSTEWSSTVTRTYKFEVLKYSGKDSTKKPLAGATFQLKNSDTVVKLIKVSDTEYRVANGDETGAVETFTTVETGNIVIEGVDLEDNYTLVETNAPTGFNKLKDPVTVKVEETNSLVVEIANQAGTELPNTGGIGTTIFYVLGSLLVMAAIVLLVTKKRMNSAK